MDHPFILASGSKIRAQLLRNAGLAFKVLPARIDEAALRRSGGAQKAGPRDLAEMLADAKAGKIAAQNRGAFVLGCDQIAALGTEILCKPESPDDARAQLARLSGQDHHLFSAAVLYHGGAPVWRFVGQVTLRMHRLSPAYISAYVARNWASIRTAVGCYKLEEEGVRLFSAVQGDYFHVLGLPLIELLSYLAERGELER